MNHFGCVGGLEAEWQLPIANADFNASSRLQNDHRFSGPLQRSDRGHGRKRTGFQHLKRPERARRIASINSYSFSERRFSQSPTKNASSVGPAFGSTYGLTTTGKPPACNVRSSWSVPHFANLWQERAFNSIAMLARWPFGFPRRTLPAGAQHFHIGRPSCWGDAVFKTLRRFLLRGALRTLNATNARSRCGGESRGFLTGVVWPIT